MATGLWSGSTSLSSGGGLWKGFVGLSEGGGLSPGSAPVAASVLSSVQADGWQGVWASGTPPTFDPNGAPVYQTFTRQGYDATGTAVTFPEALTILRRVRQVWPNQLLETASNVALQDYVLSTDSAPGVTNNSAEISPKPIANWVMRDRQMVGDTIDWEIIAFHYYARSGRQVPCVRVRANDGVNQTAWQVVSSTAVSSYCEDLNAVEVYRGTINISTPVNLNNGIGWLEAEVFPWIGASASVLRSEDSTVPREFSRRYFSKNVSRTATPPLAYVSSLGVDTTHAGWNTNAATAEAAPYLTVGGALEDFNKAANTAQTGSIADGLEIRIVDTVNMGSTTTARPQNIAAIKVTRAPGTARAAAIITMGASIRPRLGVGTLTSPLVEGAILFEDVTINRTGAFTFIGESSSSVNLQVHFRNVAFSNSSATQFLGSGSQAYFFGCVISGTALSLDFTTGLQKRMLRGVSVDMANGSTEAWVTVGCNITRPQGTSAEDTGKPRISYSNKWLNPSSTGGVTAWTSSVSGADIGPIAWVQNLIEATHITTSTAGFRFANDTPAFGNIVHAVIHHNTNTGYNSVNRNNFAYDEAPVPRFHKFISQVGDLPSQLNTKGDVFMNDGTRLGQFAYTHGVGCRGNFSMFRTNAGTLYSEFQTFPGLNCSIGTDPNTPQSPYATMYVSYQGTTGSGGTPVAGAGGGNYNLGGSSPAKNRVVTTTLGFDIAGVARATVASAGAYA